MSGPEGNFQVFYDAIDNYPGHLTHCQFHVWSGFWRHRDHDTGEAFPSVDRVARLATGGDRRHARRIIRELVSLGWLIALREGGGRNGTTVYLVCLPAIAAGPSGVVSRTPGGRVFSTPGGEGCSTPRGEGVQHPGEGVPNTPGGGVSYTPQTDQLTNHPTNQQADHMPAAAGEGSKAAVGGDDPTVGIRAALARHHITDPATLGRLLADLPDLTADAVDRTASDIAGRKGVTNRAGLMLTKLRSGEWRTAEAHPSAGTGFDREGYHAAVDGQGQQRRTEARDAATLAAREGRERVARLSGLSPDRLAELKAAVVADAPDFHRKRWAEGDPFKVVTLAVAILAKLDAEDAEAS